VSDSRVPDAQQPTPAGSNPPVPENEPPLVSEAPTGTEPLPPHGPSRRMVLLWAGLGVSGVAALGAGAFAIYASQTNKQDNTTRDSQGEMPQGGPSGMPRRDRPSGAPSGFPSGRSGPGRRGSGMPSAQPTSSPT